MTVNAVTDELIQQLRQAGAAGVHAVAWHYIEALARRTQLQTGPAQALLRDKLQGLLQAFAERQQAAPTAQQSAPASTATTSPLAVLLQEMAPSPSPPIAAALDSFSPPHESPRVRQFRQQLRQISVQKQVSKAIAQAPQNAGPINSHMLVLRALGLMRDISPDYLNRFMTHVDTLMCLQASEPPRQTPTRSSRQRARK